MGDEHKQRMNVELALARLRVELFTAAQTLKGEHLESLRALVADVALCFDIDPSDPNPMSEPAGTPGTTSSGGAPRTPTRNGAREKR